MVYYSYAPIETGRLPLPPTLAEYLSQSPPKNTAARHAALSLLLHLSAHTGLSVDHPVQVSEHGRPHFAASDAPDFNLSHTGDLAAAILGHGRVGIDVQEELDTLATDRLAARFFSLGEQERLCGAPRELFFELWTKKEALGKLLGVGLPPLLGKDTEALAAQHRLVFATERISIGDKTYTLTACASEPIRRL